VNHRYLAVWPIAQPMPPHSAYLAHPLPVAYIHVNHPRPHPMTAHQTKTFKSGNSVALRLPKSLAIGPNEKMVIEQNGNVLTVRRATDPAAEKAELLAMLAELRALRKPPSIQQREPFEFPDRPGL